MPGIDRKRPSPASGFGAHADKIYDIMLFDDLQQVVREPTRVQGDSASVLDLVFLSRSIENLSVSVDNGLSDRSMVFFSFPARAINKKPTTKTVSFKGCSHTNDESVLDNFEYCLDSFDSSDVVELWERLKNICFHCIEIFVPTEIKKTCKRTPWINREIVHLSRKIKRLKRRRAG